MSLNQAYLFYIFFFTGILIGVLFDFFRIIRKSFKTSDSITIIQDVIFWLLASCLFVYTLFKFNNGEIRSYVLFGIGLGIILYLLLFSKIFIKVNVKLLLFFKRIVYLILRIIFYPIKILINSLKKVFLKPIAFIFINIRKNIKNCINKMSNYLIKKKFFIK